MTFDTLDALRESLAQPSPGVSDAYRAKMLHPVPNATTVERIPFLCTQATGKRVLHLGASGPLHAALLKVAASAAGIDRADAPGIRGYDLDNIGISGLPPEWAEYDLIVAGEILEHLTNPGRLLRCLRSQYPGVPLIVTVPNAFSAIAAKHIARGIENVNRDHVAWYSPITMATLLQKCGYASGDLYYYNGTGPTAEGLIVVTA